MSNGRGLFGYARQAFLSVVLIYALVLQAVFGVLANTALAGNGGTAYLTVICHVDAAPGDDSTPGKDIPAKHHCMLCQSGGILANLLPAAPETFAALPDRKAAILAYAWRQDPAQAPLYLPPRISRGPPLAA
jgi:hypothetical protein